VLDPIKVVITNYPAGKVEHVEINNNPEDESMGKRSIPFSGEIFIERDDFMEVPVPKFFRLAPGTEVRLKGAYIIKCTGVKKNSATGMIEEMHCTYDPETLSGGKQAERKVKGTLHWVSASHAINAEVRLYDRLFNHEDPSGQKDHDYREYINPDSLKIIKNCKVEPSLISAKHLEKFQFQRLGYFCVDQDSSESALVFNRTVSLKDTWGKLNK
jgi:glutaminyl-tRNA synthetase